MRKLLSLLLAVMMLVTLLSACGNDMSSTAGSNDQTSSSGNDNEPKITLTMRTSYNEQGNSRGDIFEEVLNEYLSNHQNITVDYEAIDSESHYAKLNVEIAGGTTPDIFIVRTASLAEQYAKSGRLADITKYYQEDNNWRDSFIPGAIREMEGKNYLVSNECFAELIFYNKEIFAACDLKVPTSWDEFVNAVKVLKDNGYIPMSLGGKQTWVPGFFFQMIMDNVAGFETLEKSLSGDMKFNNPDYQKATQMYIDLIEMGIFNEGAAITEEAEGDAMFYQEKAAMQCTGTWAIGKWLGEDANEGFANKVGAFVLPKPDDGKGGPYFFGGSSNSSFAISSSVEGAHLDAAVDLLKYVTGPVYMERITLELGQLSTVHLPNLDASKIQPPLLEAQMALSSVESSVDVYDGVMPQSVVGAWTTAIQRWLSGDKDIEAGLNEIDIAVEKDMQASA